MEKQQKKSQTLQHSKKPAYDNYDGDPPQHCNTFVQAFSGVKIKQIVSHVFTQLCITVSLRIIVLLLSSKAHALCIFFYSLRWYNTEKQQAQ